MLETVGMFILPGNSFVDLANILVTASGDDLGGATQQIMLVPKIHPYYTASSYWAEFKALRRHPRQSLSQHMSGNFCPTRFGLMFLSVTKYAIRDSDIAIGDKKMAY